MPRRAKVPRKIVCLESYWSERLFQTFSVKGFLESTAPLVHPPLTVAHRFVGSHEGIAHYLRRPAGGYRNLVYFAACSVLRGRRGGRFAREFLKRSRVRAVIGYGTPVDWMASLACALEEPAAHFQIRAARLSCRAAAKAYAHHARGHPMNIRRVVTDHDGKGRSIVSIDERCANVISRRPGHQSCVAFTGPDGTIFRIVRYEPGVAPRNHRTETIDYAVVVSGEIDMRLDEGTVRLRAGDVLVQQATLHDWINNGKEACVIAFVLVPAKAVLDALG